MDLARIADVTTAFTSSALRLGAGMRVGPLGKRPEKLLELYEFEACPFCRKVREALSVLDLDARVYPCPKNAPTYRKTVRERTGKMQFPYLEDPNTGRSMLESDDIVRYLFAEYGSGQAPFPYGGGPLNTASVIAAMPARLGKGHRYVPARKPEQRLELWSFEASPYCKIAREALSSLEIPYVLHNVAKGSPSRPAFIERSGRMMVPYLADPNTGTEMFESADIKAYLFDTYAL